MMHADQDDIEEFRRLLARGSVQRAYRALLSYMKRLRAHFENNLADCAASDLYQGYMDITHFAVFPSLLKQHNLKVAVVFNYEAFRFEAWLVGRNQKVQRQYWELFKCRPWPKYRVSTPATGIFSILECDLATNFDLDEPDALTSTIATTAAAFINDIERFLSEGQQSHLDRTRTQLPLPPWTQGRPPLRRRGVLSPPCKRRQRIVIPEFRK